VFFTANFKLSQQKRASMTEHVKSANSRRHSAVSTKPPLTQQVALSSQHLSDMKKQMPATAVRSYRISQSSATMRVPNELRSKVQALVDSYRKQQINDPDTWN
jgi:hypothetical protein